MRYKGTCILVGIALTFACSKPPPPGTTNDLSGLPRFELVKVSTGQLLQIGPNDEVLTGETGAYNSFQVQVPWLDPMDFTRPLRALDRVHFGNGPEKITNDRFLDDTGKSQLYLTAHNIVEIVNGERIALLPIRIPSSKHRYFRGPHGIYAGHRNTGSIEKIFDHEVVTSVSARNDQLFTVVASADGSTEVIQFGVGVKPKSIHKGNSCKISNISPAGSVIIQEGQEFVCIDQTGKSQMIPNANFEVTEFLYQGKSWFVGFRRIMSSDNKVLNSYPAIWNSKGETVPLIKLCPELDGKITRLQNMHIAKIMTNSNGLIAFEMSGSNPNPEYNIGGPNPGGMSDRNYSWQTYVIRAVADAPKTLAP